MSALPTSTSNDPLQPMTVYLTLINQKRRGFDPVSLLLGVLLGSLVTTATVAVLMIRAGLQEPVPK